MSTQANRDRTHDDHDQRRAHEKHAGHRHIDRQHNGERRQRDEHRIEPLRQELLVETLHLFDALSHQAHDVRRVDSLAVAQQLLIQHVAQVELDQFSRFGAKSIAQIMREEPHEHNNGEREDAPAERCHRHE